jgi:hypothetical protein
MFTKSTIALSFAAVLSAASVPLTTYAFAERNYLELDGHAPSPLNEKGKKAQMNRYHGENAIRGEHPQQPLRWIDNPASPGG